MLYQQINKYDEAGKYFLLQMEKDLIENKMNTPTCPISTLQRFAVVMNKGRKGRAYAEAIWLQFINQTSQVRSSRLRKSYKDLGNFNTAKASNMLKLSLYWKSFFDIRDQTLENPSAV